MKTIMMARQDLEILARYSVVDSANVEAFIASQGEFGKRISVHEDFGWATVAAEEVADDYHYGVEIVDEETWEIV